jgi:CHAT domain-containing protein
MERFYRGMTLGKLAPSEALRAAQASMAREERWASPYNWAGFILSGEWR